MTVSSSQLVRVFLSFQQGEHYGEASYIEVTHSLSSLAENLAASLVQQAEQHFSVVGSINWISR